MVLGVWIGSDEDLPSGTILAENCFKKFGEEVSQARRDGDADPEQSIIADTMKLLGNSGYGKTITNKDRHRDVQFCDDDEAPKKVNEPQF